MDKTANRSSWKKILPLPTQRASLNIERTFSEQEYNRLSQGLIPESMDDRWFIFMENDVLSFHRSWTGICIYEVHFDSQRAINEVFVNRNGKQHEETDNDYDEKMLTFLIDNFLLGQNTPFPTPSNIPSDLPKGVYQHSVSGTGYPEKEVPTITFFYQPNRLRKSELAFFHALKRFYPNSQTLNQHFLVSADLVNQFIDTKKLVDWLEKDTFLPAKKRLSCLELVKKFPSEFIRVANQPEEISFDIVAQVDNEFFYWEFHEKQHVGLSVSRPKSVYTPDGTPVEVPRYFQRLIRDVWRVYYFSSYTVVWQNWFEKSENASESLKLSKEFREFSLDGKFSFRRFMFE